MALSSVGVLIAEMVTWFQTEFAALVILARLETVTLVFTRYAVPVSVLCTVADSEFRRRAVVTDAVGASTSFHFAYSVVFAARLHAAEAPAAKSVPVPFAAEFQPPKLYPDRARLPEFVDAVKEEPNVALAGAGTEPLMFPLPSYVTVYVFAVHWACNVKSAF